MNSKRDDSAAIRFLELLAEKVRAGNFAIEDLEQLVRDPKLNDPLEEGNELGEAYMAAGYNPLRKKEVKRAIRALIVARSLKLNLALALAHYTDCSDEKRAAEAREALATVFRNKTVREQLVKSVVSVAKGTPLADHGAYDFEKAVKFLWDVSASDPAVFEAALQIGLRPTLWRGARRFIVDYLRCFNEFEKAIQVLGTFLYRSVHGPTNKRSYRDEQEAHDMLCGILFTLRSGAAKADPVKALFDTYRTEFEMVFPTKSK